MCLENAFWHFGGVPRRVVLYNLKALWWLKRGLVRSGDCIRRCRCFRSTTVACFCRPNRGCPDTRGRWNAGVDYVQENALKGHTFTNLHHSERSFYPLKQRSPTKRACATTRRAAEASISWRSRRRLCRRLPSGRLASFPCRRGGACIGTAMSKSRRRITQVPPEHVGQNGVGALGRSAWCGSSTNVWCRSLPHACTQIAGEVQHGRARPAHRRRRRSTPVERWRRRVSACQGAASRWGVGCTALGRGDVAKPRRRRRACLAGTIALGAQAPVGGLGKKRARRAHAHAGEYQACAPCVLC